MGLPANTKLLSEPVDLKKGVEQMVFRVKAEEKARPGKYQSLVCRAILTRDGEAITHTIGRGELRVDKPLPPKPNAKPAAKPAATAQAKPAAPKRLSRLEQLRQEREKAREGGESNNDE